MYAMTYCNTHWLVFVFVLFFFLESILLNCMNKIVGLFLGYTKILSFISLRNSWTLPISPHSSGLQLYLKTVLFGHLIGKILGHIWSKHASLKCKLLALKFLPLKEILEGDNLACVYGLANWDSTARTSFSFEESNWSVDCTNCIVELLHARPDRHLAPSTEKQKSQGKSIFTSRLSQKAKE